MGKMKAASVERAQRDFVRDVRNLAEATLRLASEVDNLKINCALPEALVGGLNYALSDAKGEARAILRNTVA